jgi:hypothetical protein
LVHPSDEVLWRSAWEPSPDPLLAAHLDGGCERCAGRLAEVRELAQTLRAGALAEVPPGWSERALSWIRDRLAAEATTETSSSPRDSRAVAIRRVIEEIRAAIILDSAAGALLPGVRSGVSTLDRQVLCESSAGQILLKIAVRSDGRFDLQGQFVPGGVAVDASLDRVVLRSGAEEIPGRLSPHGEFRFESLPPGTIRVRIERAEFSVLTDPVELS